MGKQICYFLILKFQTDLSAVKKSEQATGNHLNLMAYCKKSSWYY